MNNSSSRDAVGGRAQNVADEIVKYRDRGDVVLEGEARRTLEDLVGGGSQGPARVRAYLDAARERAGR